MNNSRRTYRAAGQLGRYATKTEVTLMAAIWYYKLMGATHGPFTANQLREKAATGEITHDAWVRKG